MDIDDGAMEIADAMGDSFTELAPPGDERFEPVTTSLFLSYWILSAVAMGIHDGIKNSAKDATVTTLDAVGRAIRARIVPARIKRFFDHETALPEADSRQEAVDRVAEAQKEIAGLDGRSTAELSGTAASAVTKALADAGLNDVAAGKVGQKIDIQIRIVVSESAGT